MAVRLLFAGFLIVTALMMLIRECFGEPYPGPFMPAFAGTGLKMSSPTDASVIVPKIIIHFSDQSIAEISQPRLFGDTPSSIHQLLLFHLAADPDSTGEVPEEKKPRLRRILDHYFAPDTGTTAPGAFTVHDDIRQYLQNRLQKLYPGKTPVSLTVNLYRMTVPVDDFRNATSQRVNQNEIMLHEGT